VTSPACAPVDWLALLRAPAAPTAAPPPSPRPTLSVLVPAYDAAATIGEALESALSQRPEPLEVIVSDDGSRDDLDAALAPFATRVRVVRGPNGGLAAARNRAAAVARGDLLGLLDADDVWLPGRVDALTTVAGARPDLAIITTDALVVREGRPEPERYYATRAFPVVAQDLGVLRESFVFGAGAVRADAFRAAGGYDARVRRAEDWDLWLRMLLRGARAGLVCAPLYEYRRRAGSLTGARVDLALGVLGVLRGARALADTPERRAVLAAPEQRWRVVAARAAEVSGDPRRRRLALATAVSAGTRPRQRARFLLAALAPAPVLQRLRRAVR
jgi:hypothetical protein